MTPTTVSQFVVMWLNKFAFVMLNKFAFLMLNKFAFVMMNKFVFLCSYVIVMMLVPNTCCDCYGCDVMQNPSSFGDHTECCLEVFLII